MSPLLALSSTSAVWVLPIVAFVLLCGIVFVALYIKGDVFAELTLGKASLKLAAKDKLVKK
jgi:paraquat-inducible protein B